MEVLINQLRHLTMGKEEDPLEVEQVEVVVQLMELAVLEVEVVVHGILQVIVEILDLVETQDKEL